MTAARCIVLDNEPVQALVSIDHPKHRRALAFVEAALRRARDHRPALLVPTCVRVEAGWDRNAPGSAGINRLRILDYPLDRRAADLAASIRLALRVSVADAHLGSVLALRGGPVAVVTSDVRDMRRIAAHLGVSATIVRL